MFRAYWDLQIILVVDRGRCPTSTPGHERMVCRGLHHVIELLKAVESRGVASVRSGRFLM